MLRCEGSLVQYAEEGVSVCQVQIEGKESYISGSNHPLRFLFKKSVEKTEKTYLTSPYFGERMVGTSLRFP